CGSTAAVPDGPAAPDAPAGSDLVVTLDAGKVEADLAGATVRRFLKIPYARPPVGGLRWRAPFPAHPWTGGRHEADFSHACPQLANQQNAGSTDEDCLYLNVWPPEPAPAGAPVMLWMHGGGNTTGSSGDRLPVPGLPLGQRPFMYDGTHFAANHGIVL